MDADMAALLGQISSTEGKARALDLYQLRQLTEDLAVMLNSLNGEYFDYFQELESLAEEMLTRHFHSNSVQN
ncbi:hypothetical protein [Deinococcus sp. QL22]|uniref:hypothetical protein n=1 Tax=Deinococcus sp. QL22 TaxID=2939437 RepID=UPI00201819D4|nr:hypothetical protein [Deinococcus sp. QL22]UQN10010.1 hypothetical protein M1R55_26735 [Deinococcus sp. QL22]